MTIKESQGTVPSNGGREHFASRLGFILISAGCAIGLGNVWRFPYIAGEYGGAAFILLYLIFHVILGLPVMIMEFAIGRASQRIARVPSNACSLQVNGTGSVGGRISAA